MTATIDKVVPDSGLSLGKKLEQVRFAALRIISHQCKLSLAWLKRQAIREVSNKVSSIKIENYKPENPVLTVKYCADKAYFIFAKLLEEATAHPLFNGMKSYIKRVSVIIGGDPIFPSTQEILYRISEIPKPLADLYARYVALALILRSNIFLFMMASAPLPVYTTKNRRGDNGTLFKLLRPLYRFGNTPGTGGNYGQTADMTCNMYWQYGFRDYYSCFWNGSSSLGKLNEVPLDVSQKMERDDFNPLMFQSLSSSIFTSDSCSRERAYSIACLRTIAALEGRVPFLSYKSVSPLNNTFDQAMNGITLSPIFDSMWTSRGDQSTKSFSFLVPNGSNVLRENQATVFKLNYSYLRGLSNGRFLIQKKEYGPQIDFPTSLDPWNSDTVEYSSADLGLDSKKKECLYRGISHVPAFRSVAPTHSQGVDFFTSIGWRNKAQVLYHDLTNAMNNYKYSSHWIRYYGNAKRVGSSVKRTYIATPNIDNALTNIEIDTQEKRVTQNPSTPASLFEKIMMGVKTEKIFGFEVSTIPTDSDISRISSWLEKYGKFVTSFYSSQLSSIIRESTLLNSMDFESKEVDQALTEIKSLNRQYIDLESAFSNSYSDESGDSVNHPGGEIFRHGSVFNGAMDGFHSIKATMSTLQYYPLIIDILNSKLDNLRHHIFTFYPPLKELLQGEKV